MWLMELLQVSIYFKFSSEMLSRTSSQICGRWYLPIFLLRDGLFTLMYRASVMVLKRFWSSPPQYGKIVNCDIMTRDVKMVMYGVWGLDVPSTSLQNSLLTLQYTRHHNHNLYTMDLGGHNISNHGNNISQHKM